MDVVLYIFSLGERDYCQITFQYTCLLRIEGHFLFSPEERYLTGLTQPVYNNIKHAKTEFLCLI